MCEYKTVLCFFLLAIRTKLPNNRGWKLVKIETCTHIDAQTQICIYYTHCVYAIRQWFSIPILCCCFLYHLDHTKYVSLASTAWLNIKKKYKKIGFCCCTCSNKWHMDNACLIINSYWLKMKRYWLQMRERERQLHKTAVENQWAKYGCSNFSSHTWRNM